MPIAVFISFFAFILLAAGVSIYKTRKQHLNTTVGYYLGNRNLNFWMIGSSLFLTNMSANQFIGENEFVYTANMSVMAWGMSSILAMIIVAEFIMPVYLKMGAITTPDFLEKRFDRQTKKIVSVIFLAGYFISLLPSVLYGCAVALNGIFHIDQLMNISYFSAVRLIVILVGCTGCLYAVLGGLKAITITDVVQGIGMFLAGGFLTFLGLRYLGNGSMINGIQELLNNHQDHLNAIGNSKDAIPFGTLFTGMLLINIYYWGMEQYIVQESLASKNLAESQKGMALACTGKLLAPLLLNVPGLVAVHLFPDLENTATVFPHMVSHVMPPVIVGLVAAVMFGGALSTFNAGLNSFGTLFTMNLYKPWLEKNGQNSDDRQMIRTGRIIQILTTAIAIIFSPYIMFFEGGFYNYLQKVSSFFSVPVFTIMMIGLVNKKVPPIAAKIGILFFITTYIFTQFILPIQLHYLHVLAILFIITAGIMLIIGRFLPYVNQNNLADIFTDDRIKPWKSRIWFFGLLLVLMALAFLLFSPLGIA